MSTLPEQLKFINPYLQRAAELKQKEPIISYYCTYYATQLAIESADKSKESQSYLGILLDNLEAEKAQLGAHEALTSDVVGYAHVQSFAQKIFLNADNEDRAGLSSKKTAKTFLASSIFFELLHVFGDMDPDIVEKIKYAKYKATEIIKALKEGKSPIPGPPNGDEFMQSQQPSLPPCTTNTDGYVMMSGESHVPHEIIPNVVPPTISSVSNVNPSIQENHVAPIQNIQLGNKTLDYKVIGQAQKHAKFAISALQYDDIKSALENLRKSIQLLESFE